MRATSGSSALALSSCSRPSTSAVPVNSHSRSVRPFISPGVCGPRSSSTVMVPISFGSSLLSSLCMSCLNLGTRSPGACTRSTRPLVTRDCTARPSVSVSSSITGSRLVFWLQALSRELKVSGYCSLVVRDFSTSEPSARASTPSSSVSMVPPCGPRYFISSRLSDITIMPPTRPSRLSWPLP